MQVHSCLVLFTTCSLRCDVMLCRTSCDALPYHWNPTSMAERVGLPPCNSSPTLNTLPHRFSVKPISPASKSCGDGGVAKRQVEMRLTDHPPFGRFTQSASSALEEELRHQALSARERRHLAASIQVTNANFQCPDCAWLCKSRIGLQSHSCPYR